MQTYTYFDGLSGKPLVRLSHEAAMDCSTPGEDAWADCHHWKDHVEWLATPDDMRRFCRNTGGWEDSELQDYIELQHKVLWCAACDVREDPSIYAD